MGNPNAKRSRRSLIRTMAAAGAVAAIGAAPAAAGPADDAELVSLGEAQLAAYRELLALDARVIDERDAAAMPAWRAAQLEWYRLFQAIIDTPARGFAGLAVKLRLIAIDAEDGETIFFLDLIKSANADVQRLAGSVST